MFDECQNGSIKGSSINDATGPYYVNYLLTTDLYKSLKLFFIRNQYFSLDILSVTWIKANFVIILSDEGRRKKMSKIV
jgi:hypothetical protein